MKDILSLMIEAREAHIPVCLCTVVKSSGSVPRHAGSKMLVYADGRTVGSVGGGALENLTIEKALESFRTGKPTTVDYSLDADAQSTVGTCGGSVMVYIEPQDVRKKLLIIGAGHVGLAVADLARYLDMHVIVVDDRTNLLDAEKFPAGTELVPAEMNAIADAVEIDENTYIVNVSRGSDVDILAIPAILRKNFAYMGVIGSKRRWKYTTEHLMEAGISPESLERIKSPIGIDIKGETPHEIAVSILAEVILAKNGTP